MILSERRGFVFIHNPKCGGTSVREALMQFDTTSNFFWGYDTWNDTAIDKGHLPLFILRNKYPEYFRLLRDYLTFMFVRNPYARTVSGFNESNIELSDATFYLPEGEATYRERLNDFIRKLDESSLTGWRSELHHFVRQVDFAYIGQKSFIDLVMKVEEWPKCLRQLKNFLPDLPDLLEAAEKRNVRFGDRDCMHYLTRESIDRINALYKSDFDVFGYDMV